LMRWPRSAPVWQVGITRPDADRRRPPKAAPVPEMVRGRPAAPWVPATRNGNMFAQRDGTEPDALPGSMWVGIWIRSLRAGNMNGVLAVLGGFGIGCCTMNDLDQDKARRVVTQTGTNEEGTRYRPPRHAVVRCLCRIHTQNGPMQRPMPEA